MLLKRIKYFLIIVLFASNASAEKTIFTGEFVQGGIIIGKNDFAEKVIFDNIELELSKEGYFVFGFGRNHKRSSSLKIIYSNKTKLYNFDIEKSNYKIEIIDGLPPKMVTPPPEFYEKIKADRVLIKNAMRDNFLNKNFQVSFINPAEGRYSGVYGSQRILNGVKKNPHGGLDIAAPIGTPIKAMSDGKVLLAEKGLYYTGNIVIIGHGYNLKSMYIHMEDINVVKGQIVKQGQIIGTIGMTGRATGPHLHWNVYWNRIKINPELLLSISK